MKSIAKAKANNGLKKETLGLIVLTLFAAMSFLVQPTEAQAVMAMLTNGSVIDFIKFVFSFIAAIKILELISDLIKGQTDGILKDIMAIVFSLVMAISYDQILRGFNLDI